MHSRGKRLYGVRTTRLIRQQELLSSLLAQREDAADRVASLTPRQRQIMELVVAGHSSKKIAAALGISQRTVENHRATIMKKTGSKSLPALARVALAAAGNGAGKRATWTSRRAENSN
jgi:two-component system CheB/CheR fusion protein